ncbi:MAG: hypothetical protein GWN84_01430 [Gammaproteobacteria bacterium]|nr:hypothetical protein [Gammaproteobacteria bacterium]NIR81822.1 hypothetical protein [Gammaproteobacteria bacterium]NIR88654.1 hypothetical protein [Gammaproteobacteria bacterium]NIU02930.1 hypothetical protein [Gammaproteobacteria bacterium]NIV50451.1 hypothetical protein [Gammaproteobacteria bacterium]
MGALLSLAFPPEGVGMARVVRSNQAAPLLEVCAFEPLDAADPQALARLVRRHQCEATPCALVAAPDAYSLLLVEAPQVPPDELKAAVRWRIQDLIDFHIDDAVIDVFDVPAKKGAARTRMMYVAAARVPVIRRQTELVQGARLDLEVIDIPELAQRNVAAQLAEDVAGVALLHLSGASGLITVTRQSTLYLARRFELGTEALDAPLAFDGSSGDAAEGGAAAPEPWLDSLVVEVQRSLDYYESNFAQPPISALVIGPLAEPVPRMTGYLSEQLGIGVRLLDLNSVIDCSEPLDESLQARCFPAIGGALRLEARTL